MKENNAELQSKTLKILKKGWMPTSNKNLLTFTTIGVLLTMLGSAAHSLGYQQAQADCEHKLKMTNNSSDVMLSHFPPSY
jgi:hypothetical protein